MRLLIAVLVLALLALLARVGAIDVSPVDIDDINLRVRIWRSDGGGAATVCSSGFVASTAVALCRLAGVPAPLISPRVLSLPKQTQSGAFIKSITCPEYASSIAGCATTWSTDFASCTGDAGLDCSYSPTEPPTTTATPPSAPNGTNSSSSSDPPASALTGTQPDMFLYYDPVSQSVLYRRRMTHRWRHVVFDGEAMLRAAADTAEVLCRELGMLSSDAAAGRRQSPPQLVAQQKTVLLYDPRTGANAPPFTVACVNRNTSRSCVFDSASPLQPAAAPARLRCYPDDIENGGFRFRFVGSDDTAAGAGDVAGRLAVKPVVQRMSVWGAVCADIADWGSATILAQQLGFFRAVSYAPVNVAIDTRWLLGGLRCGDSLSMVPQRTAGEPQFESLLTRCRFITEASTSSSSSASASGADMQQQQSVCPSGRALSLAVTQQGLRSGAFTFKLGDVPVVTATSGIIRVRPLAAPSSAQDLDRGVLFDGIADRNATARYLCSRVFGMSVVGAEITARTWRPSDATSFSTESVLAEVSCPDNVLDDTALVAFNESFSSSCVYRVRSPDASATLRFAHLACTPLRTDGRDLAFVIADAKQEDRLRVRSIVPLPSGGFENFAQVAFPAATAAATASALCTDVFGVSGRHVLRAVPHDPSRLCALRNLRCGSGSGSVTAVGLAAHCAYGAAADDLQSTSIERMSTTCGDVAALQCGTALPAVLSSSSAADLLTTFIVVFFVLVFLLLCVATCLSGRMRMRERQRVHHGLDQQQQQQLLSAGDDPAIVLAAEIFRRRASRAPAAGRVLVLPTVDTADAIGGGGNAQQELRPVVAAACPPLTAPPLGYVSPVRQQRADDNSERGAAPSAPLSSSNPLDFI